MAETGVVDALHRRFENVELFLGVNTTVHYAPATTLRLPATFDDFHESRQPRVGLVTVDHAVVDGEGHIGHRVDQHRVAAIHRAYDDALLELADAEARGLPLVQDDRCGEQRARHSVIRDREAAAGDVRALQLSFTGASGEVVQPGADLLETERTGVLHHRDDEALLAERGADTDVDRRRDGDTVLLPAPVDRRGNRHR